MNRSPASRRALHRILALDLRALARAGFLVALAVAAVWGLLWAMNPDPSDGIGFVTDPSGRRVVPETPTPAPLTRPDPLTTARPSAEPTEDVEELIAAARPPRETSVQVLDAGGGAAAMRDAAATLGELGYDVVNTTSSRTDVQRTTVWYSEGHEAEARALRAREERVALVARNERLNEAVHLHVLVGPDWR